MHSLLSAKFNCVQTFSVPGVPLCWPSQVARGSPGTQLFWLPPAMPAPVPWRARNRQQLQDGLTQRRPQGMRPRERGVKASPSPICLLHFWVVSETCQRTAGNAIWGQLPAVQYYGVHKCHVNTSSSFTLFPFTLQLLLINNVVSSYPFIITNFRAQLHPQIAKNLFYWKSGDRGIWQFQKDTICLLHALQCSAWWSSAV